MFKRATVVLGVAGLAAALVVGLLGDRLRAGSTARLPLPPPAPSQPMPPPDETPPPARAAASFDRRPYRPVPPFLVVDGLTFGPPREVPTRLAGLSGPARTAVCRDALGARWACGLQARAALNNLVRDGDVACTPVGEADGARHARCSAGGRDIGAMLVEQGFARGEGAAEAAARAARRGLWNGDWSILEPAPEGPPPQDRPPVRPGPPAASRS